ncbi:ABC transporter ATP-binding protein [Alkalitalea saponilacus]|uniref:ATP-binding cassette, subfamily B, MsbA n=1 Tax=Alkalitalea saponilacus TaxID=889453 RepID=A0A1T5HTU6_9BACT|nr:ABC transporter ATP-binding protein [Alkalitalea saponilacus]ASB50246.1 antibiotic ABC transporter ATP-binding protein [Alkalitalea saponilacus]SKC24107.1 ATP-binding cassette, subfamily B, MsbA [Alkalitalea saponilacus]
MKDFLSIAIRYLPPYKHLLALNFMFNLLSAIFAVFSVALMIPMLEIILMQDSEVYELMPWAMEFDPLKNNLYYYITLLKDQYGPGWSLLFVGMFLITGTLLKVLNAYLASYTSVGIRNGVVRDLRHQIYNKILNLPMGFFSDERKGDIIARSTGDVQEVENSIMSSLDMFLKNPVLILVFLTTMMIFSVQLTLFVLVILPFAGLIIGRVGKSLKKRSMKGQNKMGDILGVLEETLSGLRIVKAFNAEKRMGKKFDEEIDEYRSIMNKLMRRRDLAHPMSEFLGTIVVVLVVWFGGTLILNEDSGLQPAAFLAYIGIFYQIINPAKAFSQAVFSIQKGLAAYERIDRILQADIYIKDKENAQEISHLGKNVEYKHVTFAYGDRPVLKNVSIEIPKGKTVALVGQSGSGKSTFVDLLPRFYDIKQGAITIDGIDIRDLKIHDLRNLMGNVNQEAILFNDSIYNNITFGVEHATMEQVVEAAKVANAHDFILETENGYDTVIGDRGSKLSGGQRQRLSIARAVLKNPPILILDEATSALDTESELLVQQALENLMEHRTSIVIAHRLSTIHNADKICVFHEGEIVETGTHNELIQKDGIYRKLHSLQMRE